MKRLVLVLVLALGACGPPPAKKIPAKCLDEVLPQVPPPKGADPNGLGQEAVLQAVQTQDVLAASAGGLFRLYFDDLSSYQGTPAPTQMDSGNCWRIVGQPQIKTPPTSLTVDGVTVGGIVGGPANVGKVAGHYQSTPIPSILSTSPLHLVSKALTDGTPTFPDTDFTGPSAAPITSLAFSRSAPGDDMQMTWKAGHGSYVLVTLYTQDPAHPGNALYRNRVVCRIVDDGCQRIPAGSLDWLSIYGSTATVQVERHRLAEISPAAGAMATIDATQTLVNAVDIRNGHFTKGGSP